VRITGEQGQPLVVALSRFNAAFMPALFAAGAVREPPLREAAAWRSCRGFASTRKGVNPVINYLETAIAIAGVVC